jgi:cholesterol oxidase
MAYWLSEPVESLLDLMACNKDQASCQVLVVGSGYGGAIAAMRLADPSRRVIVFERGKEYALGDFPENLGELPGHVRVMGASANHPMGYAEALFDLRVGKKVVALVGNGLGGGSLINANVALEPDAETLQHPDWPAGVRENAFDLLSTMRYVGAHWLGAVKDKETPGKVQALDRLAKEMGAPGGCKAAPLTVSFEGGCNAVGVQQSACVRCGNCVTGCNVGAKNTLATNLLPLAKARGAEIYTGATVISVEPAGDATGNKGWTVRFRRTATEKGPLRDEIFVLHARVVVLAAGTLGSTEILLRSRARKKIQCSLLLGKRFSTNVDMIAFGYAQRSRVAAVATAGSLDPDQKREVGPTISSYATVNVQSASKDSPSQKLLLEDAAIPVSLARVFAELAVSGSLIKRYVKVTDPAWFDAHPEKDRLAVHAEALQHSQMLIGMGDDGAPGELRLAGFAGQVDERNADESRLEILWPEDEGTKASSILEAADECLRKVEGKGFDGGNYIQNPAWRPLPRDFAAELTGDAPEGRMLTVHPLGGCPMGDDTRTGVVNEFGQVFRLERKISGTDRENLYEGLFVMDGAVIPRALGVNPFLTIAGLAWRATDNLLNELGWEESKTERVGIESPPVTRCSIPTKPEKVSAAIVERLVGNLGRRPRWFRAASKGPVAKPDWLAAEITIEIPDVDEWLANPDLELRGVCKLYPNRQGVRRRFLAKDEDAEEEQIEPERRSRPKTVRTQDDDTFDVQNKIGEAAGKVKLLARRGPSDDTQARDRAIATFLAYFERSGFPRGAKNADSDWGGLWHVARNLAQWRVLEYRFEFEISEGSARSRTWVLTGRKELAYFPGAPNVWTALVELPVEFAPVDATPVEHYRGTLKVDLIHLSRRALAQVREAVHTPATLMALIGTGMLALRVLFQTHFWSFRAPDYWEQRAVGNRDPHPIRVTRTGGQESPSSRRIVDRAAIKPVQIPFLVPAGREGEEPLSLRLWRYPHPDPKVAPADKVLLIHGLAHGANVFATQTIQHPLAAYLHDEGYEVWLLEHRLSPALEKACRRQSTMDEIAHYDIAEAVRYVYREAGAPIRVFAHCIGAGCFSMSVLAGYCHDQQKNRSMVKAAAIHAVPPWVVPSDMNRLRANLAAFAKDVLGQILLDPIPPDADHSSFMETLIDRLAGSLPWPHDERDAHDYDREHSRMGRAICNRMTLFYGTEWVHGNLSEATHRNLAELVGVANVETFRQIFFISQRERITDREGRNVYLTRDNLLRYWTFPTLFAHGSENQVFNPVSSRRSAARLEEFQQERAKRPVRIGAPPIDFELPTSRPDVCFEEIPGYGHMDFLFGEHASRDVYPKIGDFFSSDETRRNRVRKANLFLDPTDQDPFEPPTRPLVGPIIGWAGAVEDGGVILRVWVEAPDDVTVGPSHVDFYAFEGGAWKLLSVVRSIAERGRYERNWFVVSEVLVPKGTDEISVQVRYGSGFDWLIGRFRRFYRAAPVNNSHNKPISVKEFSKEGVSLYVNAPWFPPFFDASAPSDCVFLAGSCRHPGSPFEREAADRVYAAMVKQVKDGVDHVMLLGDQIYADATADVFDTQEPGERYGGRYREAFTTEHARDLFRRVPVYMAVDDHEFSDNWEGLSSIAEPLALDWNARGREELFEIAREAAKWYQRAMAPGFKRGREEYEPWYQFKSAAGFPFFVMDSRSERRLRTNCASLADARLVSDKQMDALERWLAEQGECRGPKFIVCGSPIGPVTNDEIKHPSLWRNSDWWFGYPQTLERLATIMVELRPSNVVFVSGDYHFSAKADLVFYTKNGKSTEAKQIIASGLYAPMPFANERPEDFTFDRWIAIPVAGSDSCVAVKASLLARGCSHFVRVSVLPTGDRWSIKATAIDADGKTIREENVC